MGDYRQNLRDAVRESQGGGAREKAPSEASERIASYIRESVVWPEKSFEVKRQRRINEVKEEARDGAG